MTTNIIINCPHCGDIMEIIEINCAIFRHGSLKTNFIQINQHATKDECDILFNQNLIYGCGKPFKLVKKENSLEYETIICDYI